MSIVGLFTYLGALFVLNFFVFLVIMRTFVSEKWSVRCYVQAFLYFWWTKPVKKKRKDGKE